MCEWWNGNWERLFFCFACTSAYLNINHYPTKYGAYMKMICCHLSLHFPGDIMTQFVKYFILYLCNELPTSKYPVLFQFVAMPTFSKWRFSLHNTRRWELENNCKYKNVESTIGLKISPIFDRSKEERISQ